MGGVRRFRRRVLPGEELKRKTSCKIKKGQEKSSCTTKKRFRLEFDGRKYTHIYITRHPVHHHYLLTSIFEIKSPPSLAISAKMASLLISALTSSSPALTGTVE